MNQPKVVNLETDEYDVFIGRPSKWGNPFKIGSDNYTREEALRRYKEWIVNQDRLMEQMGELEEKTLGCYCKPKNCHGDILLKIANH